jgi:hypothetical protein
MIHQVAAGFSRKATAAPHFRLKAEATSTARVL